MVITFAGEETVASGGNRGKFQLSNEPSANIVRCLDQKILWAKCNGGIIKSIDVQYSVLRNSQTVTSHNFSVLYSA